MGIAALLKPDMPAKVYIPVSLTHRSADAEVAAYPWFIAEMCHSPIVHMPQKWHLTQELPLLRRGKNTDEDGQTDGKRGRRGAKGRTRRPAGRESGGARVH